MAASTASGSDFEKQRQTCLKFIEKHHNSTDLNGLRDEFQTLPGSESERKLALDQAFRDAVHKQVQSGGDISILTSLINLAVEAVRQELGSHSTPFLLLQDTFDGLELEKCSSLFKFVEDGVATWKSDIFYSAGKNYLLRMCNDLLRRLSKSLDTVFCGRIQLFLARLFPLEEKSGVNLTSQFNLDNVTTFSSSAEDFVRKSSETDGEKDDSMEIEEGEMEDTLSSSIPIDYNLYRRFWSLQDNFRNPQQCYEKIAWKQFVVNADEVLKVFTSNKLDDIKSSRKNLEQPKQSGTHEYFAKYLTNEKLLDLQMSDGNFRRYVLVQFLILFQYLNSTVKFKSANQVLSEEQSNWVRESTDKVLQLLRETPPDGDQFAKYFEHLLAREENWNAWKNEGCPSYVREATENTAKQKSLRVRKRSLGEDIKATGGKVVKMGNDELTRLWNIYPSNMEACKSDKRIFLPSLEDFFEEAILQADPEQQIEEQYKLVNQSNFCWRSLRLLARRSPHFFAQTNQQPGALKISKFVESMVMRIAKEMPSTLQEEPKTELEEEEDIREEHQEEELDKAEETGKEEAVEVVTADQVATVAEELSQEWKRLAVELNFPEDDIAYIESDNEDTVSQALKMLTLWMENEAERATPGTLKIALKEVGLIDIANKVFPS